MTKVITKEQRIKALKLRARPVNYLEVAIRDFQGGIKEEDFSALLDQRIVCGYLLTWGNRNLHGEKYVKGCCANSINQRGPKSSAKYKITFLWMHNQDDPLAVFAELEEDDYGLRFKTLPLDDVPNADRCIKQIRSGTLNQFSIGFDYVWDKIEYDQSDDSLVMLEINLFEGSVVTIGSDQSTFAQRSAEAIETLHDDTEDFINTLPRKDRALARQLFARHKALVDFTEEVITELETRNEPPKNELDLNYIMNNLNLKS